MIKLLKSGDVTESGLTVTSAVSSVKETLEYNRETNSTEPGISQTVYTEITLSGEVTLEGVLYVVLDEDLYISEENSILFFPYPESLKNALGFSPRFSGDIESSYLTSNASKTSVLLYGDCVYFYAGNTDNSEWLTKDFRNKPFGTAKLTVSDIKLIWQSDSMDRLHGRLRGLLYSGYKKEIASHKHGAKRRRNGEYYGTGSKNQSTHKNLQQHPLRK